MNNVVYDPIVIEYFYHLLDILLEKEYFSFEDTAINYVDEIHNFVRTKIHTAPKRTAPARFHKYGKNLKYTTYKKSKRTTWYIFFTQKDNRYIIKHITNNHVSAQHIRGL